MSTNDTTSAQSPERMRKPVTPSRPPQLIDYKNRGLGAMLAEHRFKFIGGFVLLVGVLVYLGMQPAQGPIHLGICRTFVELQLRYPQTMKITMVEWVEKSLRIYFTHTDAFGQNQSESIECAFNPDLTLFEARRNRLAMPQAQVKAFNESLPAILANKPNLAMPRQTGGDLKSLKQD